MVMHILVAPEQPTILKPVISTDSKWDLDDNYDTNQPSQGPAAILAVYPSSFVPREVIQLTHREHMSIRSESTRGQLSPYYDIVNLLLLSFSNRWQDLRLLCGPLVRARACMGCNWH
ncbi:hypothetical protein BYT27DRAFT_6367076 [Phlegmacium glaucopus]|nr:hypothetical protein BYT27DRAFT_6367076 [Phlegmacium glaucopus]